MHVNFDAEAFVLRPTRSFPADVNLTSNQLSTFPVELAELPLCVLTLSWNRIEAVPPEISKFKMLQKLDLGFNQLKGELCKEITSLRALRELYVGLGISGECVSNCVAFLIRSRSLSFRHLNDNKLTKLPDDMVSLHHLDSVTFGFHAANRHPHRLPLYTPPPSLLFFLLLLLPS